MSTSPNPQTDQQLATENAEFWSKVSRGESNHGHDHHGGDAGSIFDSDWAKRMLAQVKDKFERCKPSLGLSDDDGDEPKRRGRLLDYACGPGAMTEMLKAYFSSVVGMDIAEGMVDKYNATYADDPSVTGYLADLSSSQTPSPSPAVGKEDNFADFDFVVVGLALHHFPDARLATSNLVNRLRPGGRILIIDWLVPGPGERESGVGGLDFSTASVSASGVEVISESSRTCKTHGFTGSEMREILVGAGCEEKSVRVDVNEEGVDLPWGKGLRFFFAHGVKTS